MMDEAARGSETNPMEMLKSALENTHVDAEVIRLLRQDPSKHVWQPWEDTLEAKEAGAKAKVAARLAQGKSNQNNDQSPQSRDPSWLERWTGSTYVDAPEVGALRKEIESLDVDAARDAAFDAILELRKVREIFRQEFNEGFAGLRRENEQLRAQLERAHLAVPSTGGSPRAVANELEALICRSTQEMNLWAPTTWR
ncbi:Hypothetical Protein FCC1311_000112 [Hondaea fermentalgiana]|uniref:Uncharacterized protein n=1 Tax=Hondaea fermentalgiana TaxID=2315210 RepID=A0A2R5G6X5_9STRA|nr:Hypothetical Protein FCC1311_000112 [Hondaea fermentalgiana]|eukprot:GBG23791.1 Hypothetical Protein FCC1311_000112 [Hondaea fermentalgiana]